MRQSRVKLTLAGRPEPIELDWTYDMAPVDQGGLEPVDEWLTEQPVQSVALSMTNDPRISAISSNLTATTDGCWIWGGDTSDGYGRAYIDGVQHLVHRYVYQQLVRRIPH